MLDEHYLKEELYEAVRDTFETMAFAELMPDSGESMGNAALAQEDIVWGRVGIVSEQLKGAELAVPVELISDLANTMYAGALEADTTTFLDTVAELTNTLTGKLMLNLQDKLGKFVLQVPETGAGIPDISGAHVACFCMVDETHPVRVVLYLN